jgi:hypothetical protein
VSIQTIVNLCLILLVVPMYSRGLSTRDIEEALPDPATSETLLRKILLHLTPGHQEIWSAPPARAST